MTGYTQTQIETRAVPIVAASESASARSIAMSTGDLSTAIRREFERVLQEQNGSQLEATKVGIDELFKRDLIHSDEVEDLKLLCDLVFQAVEGETETSEAAATVRKIYHKMVLDSHGSPAALGIASAVNSIFDDGAELGNSARDITIIPQNAATGAVVGALAGAGAGAAFGGVGAAIGAAVGAAVGAVFGACNGKEGGPEEDPGRTVPSSAATQH